MPSSALRFSRILLAAAMLLPALVGPASAAASYRYYRFTPTELRFSSRDVQLSDFYFYSESGKLTVFPTVTNPGGSNPDGEGPGNLADFDTSTKWLDRDVNPVIFDFGSAQEIDHYGFATANDYSRRDPVRWFFEGSPDGVNWVLLDDRTDQDQAVSRDRFTEHEFALTLVPDTPTISFSATEGGLTSSGGLNVAPGSSVTLDWSVTNATSVSLVRGATPISTATSGSLVETPSVTTSYTLTATNGGGSETRTITVYLGATPEPVRLSEIMAGPEAPPFLDEDGQASDWIELHNPNPFAVSLVGFTLTDDPAPLVPWTFPPGTALEPDEFLVVFASGKNRTTGVPYFHTDFALSRGGEYLALLDDSGVVVDAFDPAFPPQLDDVAYGLLPDASGYDFFTVPTPGTANTTPPGPPAEDVIFVTPPGTFSGSIQVTLAVSSPTAEIRYTTDGSEPTEASALYTGPITLTASTLVSARALDVGMAPGRISSEAWIRLNSSVDGVDSDLPVVVLENFAGGSIPNEEVLQPAHFSLFEPDATTGRTTLTSAPTVSNRIGIKRRGSSTLNNPKGNYRVEFWKDEGSAERNVNLLGMSNHDEWILYAPYNFDRALIRNAFLFEMSNAVGTYAPRTRFCEVYLNSDGGGVSDSDYQGVYVLMERISRDGERVDVEKLDADDNAEPDVTGGYMLSIDRRDPEDEGFRSALGHPEDPANASPQPYFNYVYPKEQNISAQQSAYIRGYIDDLEAALYGPGFTDPATGYAAWLDVDASIDHHLLTAFSKDPDGFRLSTFLYKPRGGKLAFGPIWDFDRAMGPDDDPRAAQPAGWEPPYETAEYFEYDYWGRLFDDPDFMQKWIDRWQQVRRGSFADAGMQARIDALAARLAESQPRNAARWPDVAPNGGSLSALSGYAGEIDHLKAWVVARAAWIDSQFNAPPQLAPGALVSAGTEIPLTPLDGTLYYTTDGSDPRLPGGALNPSAIAVSGSAATYTIQSTTTLVARNLDGGDWSGPASATFVVGQPASASNLVVSEIMYHPTDPTPAEITAGFDDDGDFEYLELQNVSNDTIDLNGMAVTDGIEFDFSGSALTLLGPGEVVLVVRNVSAAEFRYGAGLPIAGEWGDPTSPDGGQSLSNGGERILITGLGGTVIRDFEYDDAGAWPTSPDGNGPSLTLATPFDLPDHTLAASWIASRGNDGTPGTGDQVFATWAAAFFSPTELGDPSISGIDADPDGDGLANAIEFVLGSHPLEPSPGSHPTAAIQEVDTGSGSDDYLTITFTLDPAATGFSAEARFSTDLAAWPAAGVLVSALQNPDGTESLTYRDPLPHAGQGKRFVRLEVGPATP